MCAEGREVRAVVLVGEAVLEAVVAVARLAVDACDERGVDEGFACGVGALLLVGQDAGFAGGCGGVGLLCCCASARPGAGLGALVGGFGAVVEAEFAGIMLVFCMRLGLNGC